MRESWETYIDVGIVLPKLFSGVADDKNRFFEGLMTILTDPFFTTVEVSYTPEEEIVEMTRDYTRLAGAQVVFNGGDAVRRLGMDLSSLDEEKRAASVESGKRLIDQCYQEKARIMHVVTGKYTGEEEKDAMLAAFEKSLAELCAYAVEAGEQEEYVLTVSVETGDRYYDRHYLLGPTNEAVAIVRRVKEKYENVGILLDQSHFPVMREDPHKALWQARDYLSHVHIGNSYVKDMEKPYFGDKHLPFGVPDSEVGVEELARFLTTLREIGFFDRTSVTRKPLVSFEVGPFGDEPEELVIANIKRVFIEAWQKIKWKE
ncbi:sugar phosphate isomerase/epimerase family protein [Massilistercora timonensis]|uniref:sugar phosphate isomerase/epimerase family protein n=1 Tax=Massilistercora timonensis TaxID=2086584 RepID=UPI003AB5AB99